MNIVHLEPNQVPAHLRGTYAGKLFKAQVVTEMTIPAHAGTWMGGSRETYQVIRLADGSRMEVSDSTSAPWNLSRVDRTIKLEPGFAVVEHSIFCGKDMGLTFYAHPSDAVALLPAKAELTDLQRIVLCATRSYKSSYMGRDRYQMYCESIRYSDKTAPSREAWDAAKAECIAASLLNKAGAITVKGRNAISSDVGF